MKIFFKKVFSFQFLAKVFNLGFLSKVIFIFSRKDKLKHVPDSSVDINKNPNKSPKKLDNIIGKVKNYMDPLCSPKDHSEYIKPVSSKRPSAAVKGLYSYGKKRR
jgi:hypothetical protein